MFAAAGDAGVLAVTLVYKASMSETDLVGFRVVEGVGYVWQTYVEEFVGGVGAGFFCRGLGRHGGGEESVGWLGVEGLVLGCSW